MIRVDYQGLVADIREEDLKDGLAILGRETPAGRKQIMDSVEAALQGILKRVQRGKSLSPKQLQDTANDIGLWFANEVLEGRAEQSSLH